MSSDYNNGLSHLNPVKTATIFMPPPLQHSRYLDSKTETILRCSDIGNPSQASIITPNESENNNAEFAIKRGESKPSSPQLHANILPSHEPIRAHYNLNMRYINMLNFPKYRHKKSGAFDKKIKRSGISTDPIYSLTLLRRAIQPFINREINAIVRKYSENFLSVAIENVRFNLGEDAVSENELQRLQYNIMQNATAQYKVADINLPCPQSSCTQTPAMSCVAPTDSPFPAAATTAAPPPPADLRRSVLLRSSTRHLRGRTTSSCGGSGLLHSSSPLSDHVGLMLQPDADGVASPFPILSLGEEEEEEEEEDGDLGLGNRSMSTKRRRKCRGKVDSLQIGFLDNTTSLNGSSITDGDPSVIDALGPLEFEIPDNASHGRASSIASEVASNVTTHSFYLAGHWLPRLLATDAFALGSCANTWLGLGAARGRIYSKHPWLFRYACDREDKSWLSRAGHLPNCGARAFLVLAKQIHEVATMEDGFCATTVRQPLPKFTLPPWLFRKVLDSTAARANTSRLATPSGPGPNSNRPIQSDSVSSIHHSPTNQRSTFVDQFAFAEDEVHCPSDFFGDGARPSPWFNGEKSPPSARSGRSFITQSDTIYKSSRTSRTSFKT